jgi:large subunit ribosomal protein L31e
MEDYENKGLGGMCVEEDEGKEEQKTGEEPKESAETAEEVKTEEEAAEEEIEELLGKEEKKEESAEKEAEVVEEGAVEAEGEEVPVPVEEEEVKPPSREEKVEEEEIVEERVYTVPLGKCWIAPPNRRASRALRVIRSFVIKHMKLEERGEEEEEEEEPRTLVIDNEVNERVWGRGVQKPPRKIRIRAAKDKDGNITVHLAEGD